jgi:hypothetical protein
VRTTLTLDDDVAVALERARKQNDSSLKEIVNQALRRGLPELVRPSRKRKRFRTRPLSLGKCLVPSLDNVARVLAIAEGETFK